MKEEIEFDGISGVDCWTSQYPSKLILSFSSNGLINISPDSGSGEISLDNLTARHLAIKLLELSGIDIKSIDNQVAMVEQMSDRGDDFLAVCEMKAHASTVRMMLKQLMV